ncbi:MAG TPA: hypothetical protein VN776_07005 [Terracidiphilus sp.]|nr:hypothetical protein [Terracidiphilus sp.]
MNDPIEESFKAPEVWRGGFYELLIVPHIGSSEQVCSLLSAIWSFPSLDGCYLRNDYAPSAQSRCNPCGNEHEGHLYGMATLPNSCRVACGSYAMDYSGESDSSSAHWVGFYIPLGALSHIYAVGAYPFGPMNGVPEWRMPIDEFLRALADWTFQRVQFDLGTIGFEIGGEVTAEEIRANGVPNQRPNGILWNEDCTLKWFGPNLP